MISVKTCHGMRASTCDMLYKMHLWPENYSEFLIRDLKHQSALNVL